MKENSGNKDKFEATWDNIPNWDIRKVYGRELFNEEWFSGKDRDYDDYIESYSYWTRYKAVYIEKDKDIFGWNRRGS